MYLFWPVATFEFVSAMNTRTDTCRIAADLDAAESNLVIRSSGNRESIASSGEFGINLAEFETTPNR
jgi:hypothetical protein